MVQDIDFGFLIKELIKKHNVSLEDISNRIGYTQQGFGKILKKKDVNTEVLKKVCNALDIELDYFLSKSINQKGKANIAGDGNVQYKGSNNAMNSDTNKLHILENENQHLKKQIQLLEQMVEVLRGKT